MQRTVPCVEGYGMCPPYMKIRTQCLFLKMFVMQMCSVAKVFSFIARRAEVSTWLCPSYSFQSNWSFVSWKTIN